MQSIFRYKLSGRLSLAVLLTAAIGCSANSTEDDLTGSGLAGDSQEASAEGCANLNLTQSVPNPTADNSTIVFALTQSNVDPCSVNGYVVGEQDTLKMENAGNGIYFIPEVPEGEYDIIVESREETAAVTEPVNIGGANLAMQADRRILGYRIPKIKALAGQVVNLPPTNLLPVGSIKGVALLEAQTQHNGVLVAVPGTSYLAYSADNGTFEIANVVPGTHQLDYSKDQFHPIRKDSIQVKSAAATDVGQVTLLANKGQINEILLPELVVDETIGLPVANRTDVQFRVALDGAPVKVAVSNEAGCSNTLFNPVSSSDTYVYTGSFEFPVTNVLREQGSQRVDLFICTADRDNTISTLRKSLMIDLFGHRGNLRLVVPMQLDQRYSQAVFSANTELESVTLELAHTESLADEFELLANPTDFPNFQLELKNGGTSVQPSEIGMTCGQTYYAYARLYRDYETASGIKYDIRSSRYRQKVDYPCWRSWTRTNRPDHERQPDGDYPDFTHSFNKRTIPNMLWAGDRVFYWGGDVFGDDSNVARYGSVYIPRTDTWQKINQEGSPSERYQFDMHWTGTKVVIWGGRTQDSAISDGGIYDPVNDSWELIPSFPSGTGWYTQLTESHWLGDRLLIFPVRLEDDGLYNDGLIHFPGSGQWLPISTVNAPNERDYSSYPGSFQQWTGRHLVIWSGEDETKDEIVREGSIYDPYLDQWTNINSENSPLGTSTPGLVAMDDGKVFSFGGDTSVGVYTGATAIFDPTSNVWESMEPAPFVSAGSHFRFSWQDKAVFWNSVQPVAFSHGHAILGFDKSQPDGDRWVRRNAWDCGSVPIERHSMFPWDARQNGPVVTILPSLCGYTHFDMRTMDWISGPIAPLPHSVGTWDELDNPNVFHSVASGQGRVFAMEVASTPDHFGKTVAYTGFVGNSPIEFTQLTVNQSRSNTIERGETAMLGLRMINGGQQATGIKLEVRAVGPGLAVVRSETSIETLDALAGLDLLPGESGYDEPLAIAVASDAAYGKHRVEISYETNEGFTGTAALFLNVVPPKRSNIAATRSAGASWSAGLESPTNSIKFDLVNFGLLDATDVTIDLIDGDCLFGDPVNFGIVSTGATTPNTVTYPLSVDSDCTPQFVTPEFRISFTDSNSSWERTLSIAPIQITVGVSYNASITPVADVSTNGISSDIVETFDLITIAESVPHSLANFSIRVDLDYNWCTWYGMKLELVRTTDGVESSIELPKDGGSVCNRSDPRGMDYTYTPANAPDVVTFIEQESRGDWAIRFIYIDSDGVGTFHATDFEILY